MKDAAWWDNMKHRVDNFDSEGRRTQCGEGGEGIKGEEPETSHGAMGEGRKWGATRVRARGNGDRVEEAGRPKKNVHKREQSKIRCLRESSQ